MMRILPSRTAALAVALLIGAAVVIGLNSGSGDGEERGGAVAKPAREKGRTAGMRPAARGRERSKSGRELRGLSAEQVLSRLPVMGGEGGLVFISGLKLPEEAARLFQRLGALQGEAAIDEIVGRYSSAGNYAAAAVSEAIVGWMEVDREAAISAFRELVKPSSGGNGLVESIFCWKGTSFVSGFG